MGKRILTAAFANVIVASALLTLPAPKNEAIAEDLQAEDTCHCVRLDCDQKIDCKHEKSGKPCNPCDSPSVTLSECKKIDEKKDNHWLEACETLADPIVANRDQCMCMRIYLTGENGWYEQEKCHRENSSEPCMMCDESDADLCLCSRSRWTDGSEAVECKRKCSGKPCSPKVRAAIKW